MLLWLSVTILIYWQSFVSYFFCHLPLRILGRNLSTETFLSKTEMRRRFFQNRKQDSISSDNQDEAGILNNKLKVADNFGSTKSSSRHRPQVQQHKAALISGWQRLRWLLQFHAFAAYQEKTTNTTKQRNNKNEHNDNSKRMHWYRDDGWGDCCNFMHLQPISGLPGQYLIIS